MEKIFEEIQEMQDANNTAINPFMPPNIIIGSELLLIDINADILTQDFLNGYPATQPSEEVVGKISIKM